MKISNFSSIIALLFIGSVFFTILFFINNPIKEICKCNEGWCHASGSLNSFKYNDKIQIETVKEVSPFININGYVLKIVGQTKTNKNFTLAGDEKEFPYIFTSPYYKYDSAQKNLKLIQNNKNIKIAKYNVDNIILLIIILHLYFISIRFILRKFKEEMEEYQ